jgi:hypothetical protein
MVAKLDLVVYRAALLFAVAFALLGVTELHGSLPCAGRIDR